MDAATITTSSASALVAAIRTGDATARAVLDAHLAVYERRNPQVNAVIATRFDEARAEAGAADARVAAATTDAGRAALPPLLGVPVTIKESIALKGMPNSAGVIARGEFRSTETAPAAQRLIDAGAIPIGVTNTSELTLWIESWNRLYGRTSSPYGKGRTAGGSSGGEGAAVGAGIVPLGLGSDIGGSIRIPAFCGGVFGLKPTPRVVPFDGAWPPLPERAVDLFANGPIVRRAEDLMPALRVLATTEAEPRLGDPANVDLAKLRVLVSQGAWPTRVSDDLLYARERAAARASTIRKCAGRAAVSSCTWRPCRRAPTARRATCCSTPAPTRSASAALAAAGHTRWPRTSSSRARRSARALRRRSTSASSPLDGR